MDILGAIFDWASKPETTRATQTFAALLAVPGALWGLWLFSRWLRGIGLDRQVEQLLEQNGALAAQVSQLLSQNDESARRNAALTKTVEDLGTQLAGRFLKEAAPSVPPQQATAASFGQSVARLAQRTDTRSQRILALLSSGEIAKAYREFSEVLAEREKRGETLNKEDAQIARSIAGVMEKSNIAEAANLLAKAAEEDTDPRSWLEVGRAALKAGRQGNALSSFERAKLLADKQGDQTSLRSAHKAIARILEDRGEIAEAFTNLDLALAAARRNYELKNDNESLEEFASALRTLLIVNFSDSTFESYYIVVGRKYAEELIAACERIAAADSGNMESQGRLADAYYQLGRACEKQGDVDGALAAMRKAQSLCEHFGLSRDRLKLVLGRIERLTKTAQTKASQDGVREKLA